MSACMCVGQQAVDTLQRLSDLFGNIGIGMAHERETGCHAEVGECTYKGEGR